MLTINPVRDDKLIATLMGLWWLSVKETHFFLTVADMQNLRPLVEKFLREIEMLIVEIEEDMAVGFIGVANKKIEMLFVDPRYFGNGVGKKLITYAVNNYAAIYVDVNEQNIRAVNFYEHLGFELFERSEVDDMGYPFPILKLKLV